MQNARYSQNLYQQLEAILSTSQLGDIASDHKAELQGFNGWNYVAITAVAKQATRSLIYVYDDSNNERREIRKAMRLKYGHEWRKAVVREHQGKVVDATHPLVKLLKRPNPKQSGGSFRWEQVQQLRLHGSCLVFNRPNVTMERTVERYVIPMALVTPIKPGRYQNMPKGGITINPSSWNAFASTQSAFSDAWSTIQQFVNIQIPAEMLTIIRYPHPHLRGDGASPTNAASRWIDAATLIDDSRSEFYEEGPNGKILITSDEEDPAAIAVLEDRLGRSLGPDGKRVTIVGNAGTAILSKRTADEMAFVPGHDQMRDAVLAAHGVSRAMTGGQDGMTYGSLAASLLGSTMLSVQPDMDLIADEETISIGSQYGDSICIEFEVPAINDPELEDKRLELDSRMGVMTVGEYRMKRGEKIFGNRYDDYILTASGPVDPDTLFKQPEPVEEVSKIESDDTPMTAGSFEQIIPDQQPLSAGSATEKALSGVGKVILMDETMLDEISPDIIDGFTGAGYRFKNLMDDVDDEDVGAVWTWETPRDLASLSKSLPMTQMLTNAIELIEKKEAKTKKYGCVMFMLPEEFKARFQQVGSAIPDDWIASGGREQEPHITGLYGIVGAEIEEVVKIVSRMEAPLVTIGTTDSFPEGDSGIPLFISVQSEDMENINAELRRFLPHVNRHPKYTPHLTVAYIDEVADLVAKRTPLTGKACYLTTAVISLPGQDKVVVPLKRPFVPEDMMENML